MDGLVASGSLGGAAESLAGNSAEKMMEGEVKKNACCPSLSLKTRFIIFGICWATGIVFSILGCFVGGIKMAVVYSLGTMLSIGGSFFLWGPMSQLKKSFDPDRRVASALLILSICLVITFAILGITIVALIFVVVQYAAYLWYTVCMLPYGRKLACFCLKRGKGDDK